MVANDIVLGVDSGGVSVGWVSLVAVVSMAAVLDGTV